MHLHSPIAIAQSISNSPIPRSPHPVWVVIPKFSESAMKVATGLAPPSRTVLAHSPMEPTPVGPILVQQPLDKGTLPAVTSSLLWLEEACGEATVIVIGPGVKSTRAMIRAVSRAVGVLRMDRNRITAIGSSAVVARDDVLRDVLCRCAPEWWWPLWDAHDKPSLRSEIYDIGPRADVAWRTWIQPTAGHRLPLNLYQELHPTPMSVDLVGA